MTDQVSTRTVMGGRFGSRIESGADADVQDRVLKVLESITSAAILRQSSIGDCRTLIGYGQGGQTATSDAGMGAARHMRRIKDIPSIIDVPSRGTAHQTYWANAIPHTASMDEPGGLAHDMAAEQLFRDIEAIARMDDAGVLGELAAKGPAGVAERLRYLYDVTEDDEEDIKLDSLRGFAILMIKNPHIHLPQITATDDGLIQAVWRHSRQGTLVMNFQESGDIEFTLLYGRWDQGTKRRRLSGELHPDQAMLHVDHFVRHIMET